MKHSSEVLKSLIRDDEMYNVALVCLDQFLTTMSHFAVPKPPSESVLSSQLRPVVLKKDVKVNDVLQQLYPINFYSQSGNGGKDITDIVWAIRGIYGERGVQKLGPSSLNASLGS